MELIDDDVAMTFTEDGTDASDRSLLGYNAKLMEEFAVDLSLSELERIEKYATSTIDIQRYFMRLVRHR